MECPPTPSERWLGQHRAELIGLPEADAAALIGDAGLHPRTVRPGDPMTPEAQDDGVRLWLTAAGTVAASEAG